MSLHIILGTTDAKPKTPVTVVYAGRDGQAAREAMAKSTAPRFIVLTNPLGHNKHNAHAAANIAKAKATPPPIVVSNDEMKEYLEELARRDKRIEELEALLAAAATPVSAESESGSTASPSDPLISTDGADAKPAESQSGNSSNEPPAAPASEEPKKPRKPGSAK